jgi:hypothetical protein
VPSLFLASAWLFPATISVTPVKKPVPVLSLT